MNETLSLAEIFSRFESEWILIADPEVDDRFKIIRGRVAYPSKDRDEVYQKAIELRLRSSATLYTGRMPEGTAIVL